MKEILSVFSGIGGLCQMGIKEAGLSDQFQVAQFVESDRFRCSVLNKHYPHTPIHNDIRTYHPTFKPFVVVGGVPCRGTSNAGNRDGLNNQHSGLWFEMLRVIAEAQPQFVIIENPVGLIDRGLRAILGGLRMVGYTCVTPLFVSASQLGAPHKRERLFIIAYADGACTGIDQLQTARERQAGTSAEENWHDWTGGGQSSELSRVDVRIPSELHRGGWWRHNSPSVISAPSRSIRDRYARIAALGDSCTPQQAAVAWKRLYHLSILESANV